MAPSTIVTCLTSCSILWIKKKCQMGGRKSDTYYARAWWGTLRGCLVQNLKGCATRAKIKKKKLGYILTKNLPGNCPYIHKKWYMWKRTLIFTVLQLGVKSTETCSYQPQKSCNGEHKGNGETKLHELKVFSKESIIC